MKGTILTINPAARLIDITHEITPHDVMEAAFVLRQTVSYFPEGTVHLIVVDPGVGTKRRPVALRKNNHWFVGPDNGLFDLLFEDSPADEVVVLDRAAFWRVPQTSHTFHGRDIFAPVAAHLTAGRALHEVGSPISALTPLHWALPIHDEQGIQGWVVHVDHFGNCITNIPPSLFENHPSQRAFKCYAGNAILNRLHTTYRDVASGDALLLFGSSDFLEIAVNTGNASELLDIRKGMPVSIVFLDE